MTTVTTLRPGLLVKLKATTRGNVTYAQGAQKTVIDQDGTEVTEWDTKRMIADRAEHDQAGKTRSRARSLVRAICAQSAEFGLMCPATARPELDAAIDAAKKAAADFNATSRLSKVRVYVIVGQIAQDDMDAVRAINSEVEELLADMEAGVTAKNVDTIREAAGRAKAMAEMLSDQARVQAQVAVDAARKAASAIQKAEKNGEPAQIDAKAIRLIREAREVFLDLDDAGEIGPARDSAPALDLETEAA